MSKRLKVKNDFIFKRIFGQNENKEILISFLNAVLELELEKQLDDLEILVDSVLRKDGIDDKLGILDIRAITKLGEQINIEIQVVNQYNMDKRTLFYWSKIFTEQLKEGQPFNELKKTITINILDFNYIDNDNYHSVFHLWEDINKNCKLTDTLEIRFIELPKFRKAKPNLSSPLDRWLVFIEDSPEEVLEMVKNEEPAIKKAEEILNYLGSLEEIRRYYEAREMAIHDEITRTTGAREEGREEGRVEGREEGRAQGELQKAISTAKAAIERGLSIDIIADITGLSPDKIDALQREIKH